MDRINVTRSSMPPFEEYCEEIRSLWDSRWLTNMGEKHEMLTEALKKKLEVPGVSLFTNGHLALEATLRAMNLHGEVITTPFTFASTTHAIARCGLKPVFCDVKEDDYTIDPAKIEALITKDTCAIVPVHVYGNICDDEAIEGIAHEHGLKVIYDAAHAFGERANGVSVARLGDASMFSFHATKVFHTIEGGAVTYTDEALAKPLQMQKNYGITSPETVEVCGGNSKMSEFQAAMGLCNLRHLDEELAKRFRADARYRERLSDVPGIRLNAIQPGVERNCAYFPVLFDGYKWTRDEVFERLLMHGIRARKYFYPATNAFDCYDADPEQTPVALHMSQCVLCLPMYAGLSQEDVDEVCDTLIG